MPKCTYKENSEKYPYPIHVEFDDIPPVRLVSIKAKKDPSWLDRVVLATKPRKFGLAKDWCIKLNKVWYMKPLNGSIVIPEKDSDGKTVIFDGASIPLPWLVSLLTLGILRPLGTILTASIVHDYAYKFGHLKKDDGTEVQVERHVADRLFKDIIEATNRLSFIAFIAWFAVRLGWLFVPYNGRRLGGKPPYTEYLVLLILIAILMGIATTFSFSGLVAGAATVYAVFYFATTLFDREKLIADEEGSTTRASSPR